MTLGKRSQNLIDAALSEVEAGHDPMPSELKQRVHHAVLAAAVVGTATATTATATATTATTAATTTTVAAGSAAKAAGGATLAATGGATVLKVVGSAGVLALGFSVAVAGGLLPSRDGAERAVERRAGQVATTARAAAKEVAVGLPPSVPRRAPETPPTAVSEREPKVALTAAAPHVPSAVAGVPRTNTQGQTDRLAAEAALLQRAQKALREGDHEETLRLVKEHEAGHRGGVLTQERQAVGAMALCGREESRAAGRAAARAFIANHSASPLVAAVRRACFSATGSPATEKK